MASIVLTLDKSQRQNVKRLNTKEKSVENFEIFCNNKKMSEKNIKKSQPSWESNFYHYFRLLERNFRIKQ